jgi:UDP-glucose:(glucosyl)LPS alpha-1,3-glucosyltransferase
MPRLRPEFAHLALHQLGRDTRLDGPPIVFCADEPFSFQTRVALASLFLRTPQTNLDIVVFAWQWRSEIYQQFHDLAKTFGRALHVVPVDDTILPGSFQDRVLPRVAFLRLAAPAVIACDELLYLDSDLLVLTDLAGIWGAFRQDMLVGGVEDASGRSFLGRVGLDPPECYVNSGVLLISAAAWHREEAFARCTEWFARNRRTPFADQDTINFALAGRVYAIPEEWNVTRANGRGPQLGDTDPDAFRGIMHFAGRIKPWQRWCDPWSRDLYLQYARVVGLPAGYWQEATTPAQALAEAHWEEQSGNILKANAIYRRLGKLLTGARDAEPPPR